MPIQLKSTQIRVERWTDRRVIEAVASVVKQAGFSLTEVKFKPAIAGSELTSPYPEFNSELASVVTLESTIIETFHFDVGNQFHIRVERHLEPESRTNRIFTYDTVQLSSKGENHSFPLYASILSYVRKEFAPLDTIAVLEHLDEDQQRYVEQRQSSLHRLEDLQDKFFSQLRDFTLKQTEQNQKQQEESEKRFQQRLAQLETEYVDQRRKLEEERATFEAERLKNQADLRDSTTVRRSIREDVKKILAARADGIEISTKASKRRWPVLWAYLGLIAALGGLTAFFIVRETSAAAAGTTTVSGWLLARQITFGVATAVATGYFIRWLNEWASEHTDAEFNTKKFELDFERASFVVEWALEWAKEQDEIPQFLVERLSRGLFESHVGEVSSATAADAVASALFGNASSASLNVAGNKLLLKRDGINRLRKKKVAEE